MSDRSYFVFRGAECADPGFEDRAMAALAEHQLAGFVLEAAQHYAWHEELAILKSVAQTYPSCTIALEYMIPRMGKRVDAVVLIEGYIFVVEFKVGESSYPLEALNQVSDYAFDLKNLALIAIIQLLLNMVQLHRRSLRLSFLDYVRMEACSQSKDDASPVDWRLRRLSYGACQAFRKRHQGSSRTRIRSRV